MRSNSISKLRTSRLGFTLIELLVVIAILGILATIALASFSSSQMKARDAQRKSDLKAIASALEILYNDHESYPFSTEDFGQASGLVIGCPFVPGGSSVNCSWGGTQQLTDAKTIYLKSMPKDPVGSRHYYYRSVSVNGVAHQGFQLYAHLENSQDTNSCIGGNCGVHSDLPSMVNCGTDVSCNFSVTSSNVRPTD